MINALVKLNVGWAYRAGLYLPIKTAESRSKMCTDKY